jgi:carbonic anhydrase/acetyltransferase-like protein (isoleucine patch superfamily)
MAIYELEEEAPLLPEPGRYWVAESAAVIGRVRLGADVSVWFGAVLRGDTEWIEIAERSNIQDYCTIHTDVGFPVAVGPGCTIGHHVVLHGCSIGADSLIGMGSTLLNGAKIGRNCIVGARALVTEGKEFPDRSLIVGAPARTVRTVDEAGLQLIAASAEFYIQNWRRYARGLRISKQTTDERGRKM